jgi:hypothetical protein
MLPQRRLRHEQRGSNPRDAPAERDQHADAIPVFLRGDMFGPPALAPIGRHGIAEQIKNFGFH